MVCEKKEIINKECKRLVFLSNSLIRKYRKKKYSKIQVLSSYI